MRESPKLPPPDSGKSGWPWEVPEPPSRSFGQEGYPRISVITPSLNQASFLEESVRSVLLQGYPDLEYIVIDGGSVDGSVEILRKYDDHIAYWESKPDRGHNHAINKGFAQATGDILCWLSSDDFFLPHTLHFVAEFFRERKEAHALVGDCLVVREDGSEYLHEGRFTSWIDLAEFWTGYSMPQPAIFWRRVVFEAVGLLDESLPLTSDFDYWFRIARRFHFIRADTTLACSHYHVLAKTGDSHQAYYEEMRVNARRYWGSPFRITYWRLWASWVKHERTHSGVWRIGRGLTRSWRAARRGASHVRTLARKRDRAG